MKKIFILGIFVVLGIVSHGRAGIFDNSYSSVVVTYQNGVKVATGNISVDLIEIMAAGSADSFFHIYDTSVSSAASIRRYEGWSGSTARFIPVGVDLSSGCYISNIGSTPATVRIKIKPRSRI